MKIFSSFDTDLDTRTYEKYVEKYWKENVLLIYRDKLFYIIYVLLPLIFYIFLILSAFIFWIFVKFSDETMNAIKWIIIILFFLFSFVFSWWSILKRFIDYKMDFAIVCPDEIINYNQSWILNVTSRAIETSKIKTITVTKKWLLNSIFNYWWLVFLSEWDSHTWDIQLYFISNPDNLRKNIQKIMNLQDENRK